MNDHDRLFEAYEWAAASKDPSSQNGAVLIGKMVAPGVNHFYEGIPEEYENKEKKYAGIEHAERDAIYTAARWGIRTKGTTLYCPWAACRDCARGIIGSGIRRVVTHRQRMELDSRNWKDSINDSLRWLTDAGVIVDYYDGPINGAKPILVSGQLWCPSSLQFVSGGISSAVGN